MVQVKRKCCPDGYDFNASGECEAKDGSGKTVSSIDCPPCIPRPCPDDYYCDPRYNKCIPDCDKLFGSDYIFVGKRDACVNCADEDKEYNPFTDDVSVLIVLKDSPRTEQVSVLIVKATSAKLHLRDCIVI